MLILNPDTNVLIKSKSYRIPHHICSGWAKTQKINIQILFTLKLFPDTVYYIHAYLLFALQTSLLLKKEKRDNMKYLTLSDMSCTWVDDGGSRLGGSAQRDASSRPGLGRSLPLTVQLQGVFLSWDGDGLCCAGRPAGKKKKNTTYQSGTD